MLLPGSVVPIFEGPFFFSICSATPSTFWNFLIVNRFFWFCSCNHVMFKKWGWWRIIQNFQSESINRTQIRSANKYLFFCNVSCQSDRLGCYRSPRSRHWSLHFTFKKLKANLGMGRCRYENDSNSPDYFTYYVVDTTLVAITAVWG